MQVPDVLPVHRPARGSPGGRVAHGDAQNAPRRVLTQGPTPLDELATVRLHGDVVDELQDLLQALTRS